MKCCGDCVIACRRETSHCSRIDCQQSDCAAETCGGLSSTTNVQSFFGPSLEMMEIILITEPHSEAVSDPADRIAAGLPTDVTPVFFYLPAANINEIN